MDFNNNENMCTPVDDLDLMTVNSNIEDKVSGDIEYNFTDLFDLVEIQRIQDAFSLATGVASIITEVDGTPITKPSNFCSYCLLMRRNEKGLKNCMLSDSFIGSPKKDGPRIKKCLNGLIDSGASIMVGDKHIANWLIGQILDSKCNIDDMLSYADEIGVERDKFINELNKVKHMSENQFTDICNFLFLTAQQLSKLAIKNIMQDEEIARRKVAEEKIKILNYELENKVLQRTIKLQEMNEALEKKVYEKAKMQEKLQKYQLLAENANDAMLFMDMEGNILEANNAAIRIYGYTHQEFLTMNICNLRHIDHSTYSKKKIISEYNRKKIFETVHYQKDCTAIDVEVSSQGFSLGDKKVFLNIIRDITERKKKEAEILYLSYHDQLTGIYNRRFYEEKLNRLDTQRNLPMTIAIGDVNGLKLINDSFGHAAGDELLKKVAEVIKKSCRADDIIARLGGDEFIVLLPKTDAVETEQIIKRIKKLASNEKVESIDISISFGYKTKHNENEEIREILKKAEDYMYKKKLFESQSLRGKAINTIIKTLHENNKREELHANRVASLCERMGIALKLPEDEIMELKTVGLFHDIGKIAIDENILNNTGKLTDDEWKQIKHHPEIGYRILSTANDMSDMAEYVLAHHERWDGKGYPKGLKEEEIPFVSRIIAIADSYDAMTSERSYQSILPREVAIEVLQKNAGVKFDPNSFYF